MQRGQRLSRAAGAVSSDHAERLDSSTAPPSAPGLQPSRTSSQRVPMSRTLKRIKNDNTSSLVDNKRSPSSVAGFESGQRIHRASDVKPLRELASQSAVDIQEKPRRCVRAIQCRKSPIQPCAYT